MDSQHSGEAVTERKVVRRGLLASLAAFGAAVAVKFAGTDRVSAAQGQPLVHGVLNDGGTGVTQVNGNVSNYALSVANTSGSTNAGGVFAVSTGIGAGVQGSTGGAFAYIPRVGVIGMAPSAIAPPNDGLNRGVFGSSGGIGVEGLSQGGIGVRGQSSSNNAVRGDVPSTSAVNTIAIYGLNNSSYVGPGPGAGGFGVYGLSTRGHGLVGATAAAGAAAVVGATNGVAGAWAGAFYGSVIIGGDLIVVGGAKSAAVPHPDGSHRQLYCVESPESWFEDFGTGTLLDGRADVPIEPGFAAVADMDHYHVFLTAYDHDHLLYVTERTPKGFAVKADTTLAALKGCKASDLSGTFSWRVVAKRKDITGERLAIVTMPPEPVLPEQPKI
jgi:hypothetical protein